jgi:hypothetical protein
VVNSFLVLLLLLLLLLKEQLSLKRLVCTRLKTKFNAYASFHISVIEEDFPLINNTGVWPSGCIIAHFYGKLTSDQVYSSSAPPTSVPAVVPSDGTKSPTTTPVKTAEVGALTAADMSPAPRIPTDYGSGQL